MLKQMQHRFAVNFGTLSTVQSLSTHSLADILDASEVNGNLYCNSRTSVLERLRDYLRLLIGRVINLHRGGAAAGWASVFL